MAVHRRGWGAVFPLPELLTTWALDPWAGARGRRRIVYTGGAVVFGTRRPNPRPAVFGYHEVWHACTVIAGLRHFATISLVVRGA